MGRRMNLSHLSKEECEKILTVIQRDFDIRQREQNRINKIEEELNEKVSQKIVLAKRKEFNEKWCILCCSTFNLLFNKKLQCKDCHFCVCRNCAAWESHEKVWLCRLCDHQRSLYIQSCEWFYDHIKQKFRHFGRAKVLDHLYKKKKESDSENDSGYGPSLDSTKTSRQVFLSVLTEDYPSVAESVTEEEPKDLADCRQHLETVVEGLVGENLDSARVDTVYSSPEYEKIFQTYHRDLSERVDLFCQALNDSLNKKQTGDNTPTSSHAALKTMILKLEEEVQNLSELEEVDDTSSIAESTTSEMFYTNYNDLLAAAIINKVIEQAQKQNTKMSQKTSNSTTDDSQSTCASENLNGDGQSTPDREFTWVPGEKVECVVEEFEEIREYPQDEEKSTEILVKSTRSIPEELPELDYLQFWELSPQSRVSFPEMGMDLVENQEPEEHNDQETTEEEEDQKVYTKTLEVTNWEENWLFRKKKRLPTQGNISRHLLNYYFDPPYMLIPKPITDHRILVGDLEIDQLSDLSETHSVGSVDFSTTTEEEEDITNDHIDAMNDSLDNLVTTVTVPAITKTCNNFSSPVPKPRSQTPEGLPRIAYVTPSQRAKSSPAVHKVLSEPAPATVHAGKMARFECQVTGTKPLNVAWFKGDTRIENADKFCIYNNGHDLYRLDVFNTLVKDSGKFSCVVYSKEGQNWSDFSLKVRETTRAQFPPEFVVEPKMLDKAGRIQCTVAGYPEPQLNVFRSNSNVPLQNGFKYTLESESYGEWLFVIKNIAKCDDGEYLFVLTNPLGEARSTVSVSSPDITSTQRDPPQYNSRCLSDPSVLREPEEPSNKPVIKPEYCKMKQLPARVGKPLVTLRTWDQRKEDILRQKYGYLPTKIEAPENPVQKRTQQIETNIQTNAPPRPGTIAEREHKKWQNATPISNNPYSADNLNRRMERRWNWTAGRPMTYEEYARLYLPDELSGTDESVASEQETLARYQRDYYIHPKLDSFTGPEEALNSLEERVYVSSGKVFPLIDHIKRLEREVSLEEATNSLAPFDRKEPKTDEIEKIPVEASSTRPIVWSSVPQEPVKKQTTISLPSVKHLASKFSSISSTSNDDSLPRDKSINGGTRSAAIKVHSLTARSLSKEFRDTALRNVPRPMNRTSISKQEGAVDSTHGYTSDESTTSTNSLPLVKPRRKIPGSKTILQRASYWEKKMDQGLLSDTSMTEEFSVPEA